jgi:hypothetical protein
LASLGFCAEPTLAFRNTNVGFYWLRGWLSLAFAGEQPFGPASRWDRAPPGAPLQFRSNASEIEIDHVQTAAIAASKSAPFARPKRTIRNQISTKQEHRQPLIYCVLAKPALAGLKWLRDNYLAHSLFNQGKQDALLYGQLGDLLAATIPIVRHLERAIKGSGLEDGWPILGHHYAWTFWPVVERGMRNSRRRPRGAP